MSINENELLKRDSDRNIGDELLQMVREIKAGKNGRKSEVDVSPIVMARHKIGHSQVEFAKLLAFLCEPCKNGNMVVDNLPVLLNC